MNHDQLLAKINANLCSKDGCDGEHYKKDNLHGEWFALRAVVELHTGVGIKNRCVSCSHGNPCETIQAIEKELL